ncbi:MAG: tetratricopeptide repeat protein, partial [Myxococcales bacterium]
MSGPYVEPSAYAAFLRGALAEARGDLAQARVAYTEASRLEPHEPEPWTHLASVACASGDRQAAQVAFSRALALAPDFAGTWDTRRACAEREGDTQQSLSSAERAVGLEPLAVDLELALIRRSPSQDGARLWALTLVRGEDPDAWHALALQAKQAKQDGHLETRARLEEVRRRPSSLAEAAAAVERLVDQGELISARLLAGGLVDLATSFPLRSARWPLVARLAVDQALLGGDEPRARQRAIKTHLGLEELAARAALLGHRAFARAVAEQVAAADAGAMDARFLLLSLGTRLDGEDLGAGRLGAATFLVWAQALWETLSTAEARWVTERTAHEALGDGDPLLTERGALLAWRGVLRPEELGVDAGIELSVLRRAPREDPRASRRYRILAKACAGGDAADENTVDRVLAAASACASRDSA